MGDPLLRLYVWQLCYRADGRRRERFGERGEGVISAAIAVLIMAFLGAALWVGFKATLDNTQDKVDEKIGEIGS
ncbi:MAG TPA: hypothetical protein VFO65_02225 [Acidimicrobiales bacterium]|nr:hypothetical protein [Acidimicrobiales bacterium]